MTVEVDIFNLIIVVVVILVAAFLVTMIWELKKISHKVGALLDELDRELPPTLRDCREITERINRASVKIEKGSENAACLILGLKAASKVLFKETRETGEKGE